MYRKMAKRVGSRVTMSATASGMALALSLHDAGFDDVDVCESAPSVKELGVTSARPDSSRGADQPAIAERGTAERRPHGES